MSTVLDLVDVDDVKDVDFKPNVDLKTLKLPPVVLGMENALRNLKTVSIKEETKYYRKTPPTVKRAAQVKVLTPTSSTVIRANQVKVLKGGAHLLNAKFQPKWCRSVAADTTEGEANLLDAKFQPKLYGSVAAEQIAGGKTWIQGMEKEIVQFK